VSNFNHRNIKRSSQGCVATPQFFPSIQSKLLVAPLNPPCNAGDLRLVFKVRIWPSHSHKEDPSVPIYNRASSPIMGAFLCKGAFSVNWLKKKPPLAGEVPRLGTVGSLFLRNVCYFAKSIIPSSPAYRSKVCTMPTDAAGDPVS
jgi:hypothetical protein